MLPTFRRLCYNRALWKAMRKRRLLRIVRILSKNGRAKSMPSVTVRFAPRGWNQGAVSWFVRCVAITCRARTTTEVTRCMLAREPKFASEVVSLGGRTVALKITDRVVDGVTVEALEGRIVLGEESNALREKVKSLLAAGQKKIVLNMDNVTYIDSSGLGTLVASHTTARSQGASLKISNLGSKFQEILQVTKLVTVFEVYPSEVAAIGSFGK